MQSLVLATSLLLSSPNPVAISDIEKEVNTFVSQETNKVSNFVNHRAEMGVKDNILFQARIVIRQAKAELASRTSTPITAE